MHLCTSRLFQQLWTVKNHHQSGDKKSSIPDHKVSENCRSVFIHKLTFVYPIRQYPCMQMSTSTEGTFQLQRLFQAAWHRFYQPPSCPLPTHFWNCTLTVLCVAAGRGHRQRSRRRREWRWRRWGRKWLCWPCSTQCELCCSQNRTIFTRTELCIFSTCQQLAALQDPCLQPSIFVLLSFSLNGAASVLQCIHRLQIPEMWIDGMECISFMCNSHSIGIILRVQIQGRVQISWKVLWCAVLPPIVHASWSPSVSSTCICLFACLFIVCCIWCVSGSNPCEFMCCIYRDFWPLLGIAPGAAMLQPQDLPAK